MMRMLSESPSSPLLAYITFFCFCLIILGLCEANRHVWDDNIILQNVTSAVFCVYSAILYLTYTIITKLLHLVLTYAESNMDAWRRRYQYNNVSVDYDSSDTIMDEDTLSESGGPDELEDAIPAMSSENVSIHEFLRGRENLSRSTIISSMYLGGSGAFLSIIPLCMWDFSATSAFINTMLTISMADAKRISSEFKPDVDKVQALRCLRWLRNGYHIIAFIAATMIGYLDMKKTSEKDNEIGKVFMIKWPYLFLASCGPILLRAGGGGVGNFAHSISPSQTLEIGLPVSVLLAILVLCWYSPIEGIVRSNEFKLNVAIPMALLCPLCIAGCLTFILYGMKRRSCGVISVILVLMLTIRQQIHRRHHLRSTSDIASFIISIAAVLIMALYLSYKYKVQSTYAKKKGINIIVVASKNSGVEDDTTLEEAAV